MIPLTKQITLGIGAALAFVSINAVISYRNIQALIENEHWVTHTNQVLASLEETFSTLKDAETGQRGYIITGEERYLQPYNKAIATLSQQLENLQQLTRDNPRHQQQIQQLKITFDTKLSDLEQTINLRRTQGLNAGLNVVKLGRGKQIMDGIRQQVAEMKAEENRLLEERSKESQNSLKHTLLTFTIATGLDLLLLVGVYYLVKRDELLRQQEEEKQKELFNQLQQERDRLKISEERLHRAIIYAPLPTILHAEGGEVFQINHAWEQLTGHPCNQIRTIGDWLERAYESDRRATIQARIDQLYSLDRGVYEGEATLLTATGEQRIWDFYSAPLGKISDGRSLVITTAIDITKRKQNEAEIMQLNATLERRVQQRTQQLEEVNTELESFTYSVAHDLRAPLRGMRGLSEALLEDYGDRLDEIGKEYAQHIVKSGTQLEELIQDLLAYSRLSRAELNLQVLKLDSVVAEAVNQIKSAADYQQAEIIIDSPLPCVIAHRATLIQVIVNLISNAIKFVDGKIPQVKIWAELVEERRIIEGLQNTLIQPKKPQTFPHSPTPPLPHSWIRLWVEDNGIGIAIEHQKRIFRVFERLHGTETYPGTGIGLAIAQKGIDRMGGKIGVESSLGQGSKFWLELKLGTK